MSQQEKNNIRITKGIEGYYREKQVLIRLIRKLNVMSASKFDELFMGREFRRPTGGCRTASGDSFILGMCINGISYWSFNLDLLQKMVLIGLVETFTKNEQVHYRIPNK